MKKPTLLLHIGSPKSGTTTIQNSLTKNKDYLKEKNFFFEDSPIFIDRLRWSNPGWFLPTAVRKYKSEPTYEMFFTHYMDRFLESGCETALISNANLADPYEDKQDRNKLMNTLKTILSDFDVKIFCYLRRQDLYFESYYNHELKLMNALGGIRVNPLIINYGVDKSISIFDNYVNKTYFRGSYDEIVSDWADTFGKENITIIPFERGQLKNGLIYDFYSNVLTFSDEEIARLEPVKNYNESICRDILEFKIASKIDDFHLFVCANNLTDNINTNQRYFTFEQRKQFLDSYEKVNSFLARKYLGRSDGKLFYDPVEEYEAYSGLSLEKAKEIGKKLLALIYYNNGDELFSLDSFTSVEDVIQAVRRAYFDNVSAEYVNSKLLRLFTLLNGSEKTVVIYGAFGKLAEQVFKLSDSYQNCVKIYVSDKSLNDKLRYKNYGIVKFNELEILNPDIIIISSKFSGKAIKRDLEKLSLLNATIYPAYDFSDEVWEEMMYLFFASR